MNFLFSLHLPTFTVVSPSCASFISSYFHFYPGIFHSCSCFQFFFSHFYLMSPVLQLSSFLHFSTFTLVSAILRLFSHILSFFSWWQLHAASACLSFLPPLRSSHFPHHPPYNNSSTCCLAFFLD